MFMPWSDDLLLGIDKIDDQHHWLVDTTNRLHDEISTENPGRDVIGEILYSLVEYAINHFIMEEELFQRYEYPQTAEHKAEHDNFNAKIHSLLEQFESGETVNTEVMEFLKNWLLHHILENDKAYAPYLKQKMDEAA